MNRETMNRGRWWSALLHKYFTTESFDYRKIISIIIPIFVDQSFIIMMSLLNTAMISSSGIAAVSAVSIVDSLNIFLINVFVAIATGGTVIVAQYKGSRNAEMVSKSAAQAISAVALVSIAIAGIIVVVHTPVLDFLFGRADAEVLRLAQIYLIGSCIAYPFIAIFEAVTGALRGVADTKSSLYLSLIMNVTYLVLNIVFINLFHWGIYGLLTSLFIARSLGMVTSIYYLLKRNKELKVRLGEMMSIHFPLLKKILFIGLPFAAEQMFFNGGKLLTQTFVVQLGTLAITTNAIASSLGLVYQIGGTTLSIAIVTVVGQCIGRRSIDDARRYIKSFLGLSSIFFVLIALILLPLFPVLVHLFSPPTKIVHNIFLLVLYPAIAQPFLWSISFMLPSALRAAGDSNFTSIASLLSMWLFRITSGYLLAITLHVGLLGIWIAMLMEWGVRGIIFMIRFRGSKWYSRKLI